MSSLPYGLRGASRRAWPAVLACGLLGLSACAHLEPTARAWPELTFGKDDRILVLAPHPDDDVAGCGGLLQRAAAQGVPTKLVFLTLGDSNTWPLALYRGRPFFLPKGAKAMGQRRRLEAIRAANALGLRDEDMVFLGYPDCGAFRIWLDHWGGREAYRAVFTRARAVPYPEAYRPGAPYQGEEIMRDIEDLLAAFKPTRVFVSHPADYNGDHRALYLFTRIALWNLKDRLQPEVLPFLVHYPGWPCGRGRHPGRVLEPPIALKDRVAWKTLPLTAEQVEIKGDAMHAYRSQLIYNARFLHAFARTNELFGDFPDLVDHPLSTDEGKGPEREEVATIESPVMRIEGDRLVVELRLKRSKLRRTRATIYAFGYRSDIPFADMPKWQVDVGRTTLKAFDRGRPVELREWEWTYQPRGLILKIPLRELGDPERILAGSRTHRNGLPYDRAPWRILRPR